MKNMKKLTSFMLVLAILWLLYRSGNSGYDPDGLYDQVER